MPKQNAWPSAEVQDVAALRSLPARMGMTAEALKALPVYAAHLDRLHWIKKL